MSELFNQAVSTLAAYGDDAASVAKEREADRMIDDVSDEDISEKSFTDRLMSDPMLWLDHCGDALFTDDGTAIEVLSWLNVCRNHEGGDELAQMMAFTKLGEAVYKEVMAYCARLEAES